MVPCRWKAYPAVYGAGYSSRPSDSVLHDDGFCRTAVTFIACKAMAYALPAAKQKHTFI